MLNVLRKIKNTKYAFASSAVFVQAQRSHYELELDADECIETALKKEPPMLLAVVSCMCGSDCNIDRHNPSCAFACSNIILTRKKNQYRDLFYSLFRGAPNGRTKYRPCGNRIRRPKPENIENWHLTCPFEPTLPSLPTFTHKKGSHPAGHLFVWGGLYPLLEKWMHESRETINFQQFPWLAVPKYRIVNSTDDNYMLECEQWCMLCTSVYIKIVVMRFWMEELCMGRKYNHKTCKLKHVCTPQNFECEYKT